MLADPCSRVIVVSDLDSTLVVSGTYVDLSPVLVECFGSSVDSFVRSFSMDPYHLPFYDATRRLFIQYL